jgi:hypothetical protein
VHSGDPPDGQFGVVGDRCADPDDDGIDQRPQAVQMGKPSWTIYKLGVARFSGNATIKGLTNLAHYDKVIHGAFPERSINFVPGLR